MCNSFQTFFRNLVISLAVLGPAVALAQTVPPTTEPASAPTADQAHKANPGDVQEVASSREVPDVGNTKAESNTKPQVSLKSDSEDKADQSYILGIADELKISVWKEPDLSGPVVVRPDGMITLPVIDDVYVLGLTTQQVQDILTQKLKSVVTEPQVTVIVQNIRSRKVYLVGQVGHPGAVSLTGHETVLQILAESGGPNPFAKADKIYILRKVGDQQQKLTFNYKKAVKGSDPKGDFTLENGDVIVVP